MEFKEETGKLFKVAASAIFHFPKEFQVKEVVKRAATLEGGPVPEWTIRLVLRCLEAHGLYKHFQIDGRTIGWICTSPDFLSGTGTYKLSPLVNTLKLLMAWDVKTDRQKIREHLAKLPIAVQDHPAGPIIAALDRTSHSMAIRNMPTRFSVSKEKVEQWIEQWKIKALVYVDRTTEKQMEVLRKTEAWTVMGALDAVIHPSTLMPIPLPPTHRSAPLPWPNPGEGEHARQMEFITRHGAVATDVKAEIQREQQEAARLAAIEQERKEAAELEELARLKAANAERRKALGL